MGILDDLAIETGKFEPSTLKAGPMTFKFQGNQGTDEAKSLDLQNKRLDIKKKQKEILGKELEIGKIPAAQLGYYTMASASIDDYNKKIKEPLERGELTYDDIKAAYFKTPTDKTSILNTALYAGADAWLRIQTGAQANPSEIQREMDKYKPRPWDSPKAMENKFKSLFVDRLGKYKQNLEENVGKKNSGGTIKPKDDPLGVF